MIQSFWELTEKTVPRKCFADICFQIKKYLSCLEIAILIYVGILLLLQRQIILCYDDEGCSAMASILTTHHYDVGAPGPICLHYPCACIPNYYLKRDFTPDVSSALGEWVCCGGRMSQKEDSVVAPSAGHINIIPSGCEKAFKLLPFIKSSCIHKSSTYNDSNCILNDLR